MTAVLLSRSTPIYSPKLFASVVTFLSFSYAAAAAPDVYVVDAYWKTNNEDDFNPEIHFNIDEICTISQTTFRELATENVQDGASFIVWAKPLLVVQVKAGPNNVQWYCKEQFDEWKWASGVSDPNTRATKVEIRAFRVTSLSVGETLVEHKTFLAEFWSRFARSLGGWGGAQ